MADPAATVFVLDDDPSVGEAIEGLLASAGFRVRLFGCAGDFRASARPDGPSCLVLDVRLPDADGLDLQAQLAISDGIPVVIITGHGDIRMTVRAMKAGAVEFLAKPFRGEDLLAAVEQAIERDRATRQLRDELNDLRARYDTLTSRERQVMDRIVAGRMNKHIAAELGTSEITIKVHRGRVMAKMRARSLPDLVRVAEALRRGSGPLQAYSAG